MNSRVRDVMTTHVVWVEQDTPFAAIAAALRDFRVSAFPVLDDAGRVIGVVSESDLLAKLALDGGADRMPGMITGLLRQHEMEKARGLTAADVMSSPAATISPDDTVEHAAKLMYLRRIKRLPVVGEDNHLAGIVSRADLLTVYGRPDVEIGEEIRASILAFESPAERGTFNVSVTDGVATLEGTPQTRGQGDDIVRRVRRVQGVVAVRDRFDNPPPGPEEFDVLASFPSD